MNEEQRHAYEIRKKEYYARQRMEKEHKRTLLRQRILVAILFITVLTIILGSISIIVSTSITDNDAPAPKLYTFKIDDQTERVAYHEANQNGVLYINMLSLKTLLNLTDSNTPNRNDSLTFTSQKTGSNVIFTNGSRFAIINNQNVDMKTAATVKDDLCSVPLSFVARCFGGIEVEIKKSTVYITKTDNNHEIFAKSNTALDMVINFESEGIEEYEQYMNPTNDKRDAFLLLVNKKHPLGSTYIPENLVSLSEKYCQNANANQLNSYAAKALEAMLNELWAQTSDLSLTATSGYRSYARQLAIFNQYIEDERAKNPTLSDAQLETLVLSYSAKAGTSEHQSGLCVDLIDTDRGDLLNYADTGCFTSVSTYNWLKNNAWKFGFILRYPDGKEDITGYSYESWHFRYVGRYHAQRIYSSDLTFEEYLSTLE